MDTDEPLPEPSNWQPITDKVQLAKLGKFTEELGEGVKHVARMIIQGIDGTDPKTGETNRNAVIDEIADMYALGEFVLDLLEADRDYLDRRISRKTEQKRKWFAMLENEHALQISATEFPNLYAAMDRVNRDNDCDSEEVIHVPGKFAKDVALAEAFLHDLGEDDLETFLTMGSGVSEISAKGGEGAISANKLLEAYFQDWQLEPSEDTRFM